MHGISGDFCAISKATVETRIHAGEVQMFFIGVFLSRHFLENKADRSLILQVENKTILKPRSSIFYERLSLDRENVFRGVLVSLAFRCS